jgi:2-oxoacid:acceptor oxidoreductase gamma subunit (pyruvate/2-ketoisovalerate family)
MLEFRFHGFGGDGAVIAGKIFGLAVSLEGGIAQIVPAYQATRRGGSVDIHLRVDEKQIFKTSRVYNPDGIVLFNSNWENRKELFTEGLKNNSFAILNTRKKPDEIDFGVHFKVIGVVDATGIALETIQRSIPNTAMLGAISKTLGIVKIESLEKGIKEVFPEYLHKNNILALRKSYDETKVKGNWNENE